MTRTAFRWIGTRPVRPDGVEKVNGRARFGADRHEPGMLYGAVLRSPFAHARLLSIDPSAALAIDGVHAIVTREDFPDVLHAGAKPSAPEHVVMPIDPAIMAMNVMAREKVLYHGHVVAAVAARTESIANRAMSAIRVVYDELQPVLTVDDARKPGAPVIDDSLDQPASIVQEFGPNVALRNVMSRGDVAAGFRSSDCTVERTYTTPAVHQAYIEPHACLARADESGRLSIWSTTQGAFLVRAYTALILGRDASTIEVTPSEIGGGFGGKLIPYLEPVAAALALKSGRPVKMTMSREEVFRATGPAPATRVRVRIGANREGRIQAMQAGMEYEAGAFKGGSMHEGQMNIFSCYSVQNLLIEGTEYLVNKPNVAPYRAPGLPQALLACEAVVDELARDLGIDPVDLRLLNAVDEGDTTVYNLKLGPLGLKEALQAARRHPHYESPLPPDGARGVAAAFYLGAGCQSSVTLHLGESGKVQLLLGTPDIGGSRAALAMMAAETLDIPYESVTPTVASTTQVAFSDCTGGSRVTFATGLAVVRAAEEVREKLRQRAALIWRIDLDAVSWKDSRARNRDEPEKSLSIEELAATAYKTGGTISSTASVNASGAAPGCAVNIADVSVDRETGVARVVRFTAIQDAGIAIHPDYVEGQMQGGAAQGIGWALTEELVYDERGVLRNPGFLDYRIPVCSDLPMIETQIIEVPNPAHPFGVRGVGETPICAPMAAVAIAVNRALGTNLTAMPLNPSRIVEALTQIAVDD